MFNPRSQVEVYASQAMRFLHPYIGFITYRFHVEKAREIGIRIEDFYMHKFHKEPYVMWHIYAQYFHPTNLLERVRDVNFYRRPRTLFKGFKVPDWATADKTSGWQTDQYSQQAWDNAWADFNSECTPMQFWGERQEPNIIEWFRLEQFGKGMSSRLFYNEVPKPTWFRHQGHLDNPEEVLYSFTNADQPANLFFGIDTTTEEGRAAFKAEYDALAEIAPEIVRKEDMMYPHELPAQVSTEAHFQRVWRYYREYNLKKAIDAVVADGQVSQYDADAALRFLKDRHHLSVLNYVNTKAGARPDLEHDEGFLACDRVFNAMGLNEVALNNNTAEPYESQFWDTCDAVFNLTPEGLKSELPILVTEDSNRRRVEEILSSGHTAELHAEEETQQLL